MLSFTLSRVHTHTQSHSLSLSLSARDFTKDIVGKEKCSRKPLNNHTDLSSHQRPYNSQSRVLFSSVSDAGFDVSSFHLNSFCSTTTSQFGTISFMKIVRMGPILHNNPFSVVTVQGVVFEKA